MLTILVRTICVGIASVVMAAGLAVLVGISFEIYSHWKSVPSGQEPEVGWDLLMMAHNYPYTRAWVFLALFVFVAGSFVGFRHFSKRAVGSLR